MKGGGYQAPSFLHPMAKAYFFLSIVADYDLFCSFLATVAAMIHWFNPLIWWAVKKMRHDREIACDAFVMEMFGEEERISYGTTIIRLANLFANGHKQLSLASFYEGL